MTAAAWPPLPNPGTVSVAPVAKSAASKEQGGKKRKRAIPESQMDYNIRLSGQQESFVALPDVAEEEDDPSERPKKRVHRREEEEDDDYFGDIRRELAAYDEILQLCGILDEPFVRDGPNDHRSLRLRQYEYIAFVVQDLLDQRQEGWDEIARLNGLIDLYDQDLDTAKADIDRLEVENLDLEDLKWLFSDKKDRVEELEEENAALKEKLAKLQGKVDAAWH